MVVLLKTDVKEIFLECQIRLIPVCNRVCCWTWESCLNRRSQYEHLYGFSPVWTRMCWTNWWFEEKAFRHCWHWCGLTSRPTLPPPLPPPPDVVPAAPNAALPSFATPTSCEEVAEKSRPWKCIAVFVIRYWKKEIIGTCAMVICISLCNYGSGFFGGVIEFGAKAYFPEMNSAQWGASSANSKQVLRKSSRQNVQTQDSAAHEFWLSSADAQCQLSLPLFY